ncbi:MAG: tetratricopeptide repeat protein [Flavisolibacter sp.]
MSEHLELIDAYFNQTLSPEESERFSQRLVDDKEFADEVAFYLAAKQVIKEQKEQERKLQFRQLLENGNALPIRPVKKMWMYGAAAAAVVLLVITSFLYFLQPVSVQSRADSYIRENLVTLSVTMGTSSDNIQQGLKLYNEGQLDASKKVFESIVENDTSNYSAKKYLGIVYLRLANYDKALLYFQHLENYSLYSNPAIFYQALTLMKRNLPGDKAKAKQLLQQVIDRNLEGKSTAQQYLKNW